MGIVGAGELGVSLANELRSKAGSYYRPMCFIDRDKDKVGNTISGLRVFHPDEMQKLIQKFGINELIVAINNLNSEEIKRFYDFYKPYGCKVKIYDTPIHDAVDMREKKKRIVRDFQIEDLLFRKPLSINNGVTMNFYRDKVILVTGGGGSIGSEICRQIAKCAPKRLIIF